MTLDALCAEPRKFDVPESRLIKNMEIYHKLIDVTKPLDEQTINVINQRLEVKIRRDSAETILRSRIEAAEEIFCDRMTYYIKSEQYGKLIDLSAKELPKLTRLHKKYGVSPHYTISSIYYQTAIAYKKIAIEMNSGKNMIENARLAEIVGLPVKNPEELTNDEAIQLNDRLVAKFFEHYLRALLIDIRNKYESHQENITLNLGHVYRTRVQSTDDLARQYEIAVKSKAFTPMEKIELREFFSTKFCNVYLKGLHLSDSGTKEIRPLAKAMAEFYKKPLQ